MNGSTTRIASIVRRELIAYFTSPLAYVFIVIFLLLTGFFTFASSPFGNFFNNNEATLAFSFFSFQPWLYLVLVPPIAMRLWAEEQRSGTIELLFTMPISVPEAILGKFLAAWCVILCALALTFPIVITVNLLGHPDQWMIVAGYVACALMSGAFLALGCLTSTLTKNQVISFIISVVVCLALLLAGHTSVTNFFTSWAPVTLVDIITGSSALPHFYSMEKGVLDFRDVLYFVSMIVFGLFASGVALQSRRRAWN